MGTPTWTRTLTILLLLLLPAAHVQAQADGPERVRTDSRYLQLVIASGMERSPTFHAIIDRLEASDLIVEVQCGQFTGSTLAGRTVLLSAQPSIRYVLVEISCPTMSVPALGTIAHELRHALEIAASPWVVDGPSLAQLYENIGYPTLGTKTTLFGEYETGDALDAGERVHHELFHPSTPTRPVARLVTK
jgi:hypothetical protein